MTALVLFSNNKTFRVDIPDMQPADLPQTGALCAGYVIYPPDAVPVGSLYPDESTEEMSHVYEQA